MKRSDEFEAQFRERLRPTYHAVLAECIAGLELSEDVHDVEQASFWAHKLIASSALMGHSQLSAACRALEARVEAGAPWSAIADEVHALVGLARDAS